MSTVLENITQSTVARYSERFNKLGKDVRTLGWGTKEQQYYRFEQVMLTTNLKNKNILDIGCGFGDFLSNCINLKCPLNNYTGWDINPDLIAEARRQHPSYNFSVQNIAEQKKLIPIAEIGVMLGVLNFNLKEKYDNLTYSKMMIQKAFACISETLIVDFLSIYRTPDYPKEDFVFYHDPAEMLAFALQLTPNVKLIHDYVAIPQKEFMLVLRHV